MAHFSPSEPPASSSTPRKNNPHHLHFATQAVLFTTIAVAAIMLWPTGSTTTRNTAYSNMLAKKWGKHITTALIREKQRELTPNDETCKALFLDYMNSKARQMGMPHTRFADASGYVKGQSTITPLDAITLITTAHRCADISEAWGKTTYEMHVKGPHERTDTIGTGRRAAVTDYYQLLGGKTGTLAGCHNAVFICRNADGITFVAAIINSSWEQRWPDLKKLIDIASRRFKDQHADVSDISMVATGAFVTPYPMSPLYRRARHFPALFSLEPATRHYPASVTKVMTALCMMEWIDNLDRYLCIKSSDLMPGSGPKFFDGDSITYRDALHAMLLPSSNTAAVALSRTIGQQMATQSEAVRALLNEGLCLLKPADRK